MSRNMSIQQDILPGWKTRDLLVVVVLALVFALITGPILSLAFMLGAVNPLLSVAVAAVTTLPSLVAPYILRRPGSALLAQLLMGLIQFPFAAVGFFIVIVGLVNGIVGELPFFVTRYRNYSLLLLMTSGILSRLVALGFAMQTMGFINLATSIQVGLVLTATVAGIIVAGLAKYLCDALAKQGALNGFPIGQTRS